MSQKLSPKNGQQTLNNGNTIKNFNSSEYQQLNMQHNTTHQFMNPVSEPQNNEYNSDAQRKMLSNFQQSFNEQRETYTEQAVNNYGQQQGNANVMHQEEDSPMPPRYNYEAPDDVTLDENTYEDFERYTERVSTGGTASDSTANMSMNNSRYAFSEKDEKIITGTETLLSEENKGRTGKGKSHSTLKEGDKRISVDKSERLKDEDRLKRDNDHPMLKENKEDKSISTDKVSRLKNKSSDNRLLDDDKKERLLNGHDTEKAEDTTKNDDTDEDTLKRKKFAMEKPSYSEGDKRVAFVRTKGEKELRVTQKQVNKQYNRQVQERDRKDLKKEIKGRLMFSYVESLFDDENIQKDETAADMSKMLKKGRRTVKFILKNNERDLRNMYSQYGRLKYITKRDQYHISQKERLDNKYARRKEREYVKEAAAKEERKRRKKEMQKVRTEREGNFIRRTQSQFKLTKRSVTYKTQKAKRTLKTIAAVGSIAGISMLSGVFILIVILCTVQGAGEYYAEGVVQADYGTITDATEYFKNLEADLEEYISDKTTLESDLRSEHGNDIHEFHYNICGFGFSANTILAYIAAKYNEFTLDDAIKADLKEVLQEMYVLTISIQMEDREIDGETEQKKICYVTLSKTELEEVVENRLTEDQLRLYQSYKLTTGGQQVYGPVMRENWTNLISSNYGDRIHPITKVRTTHKGVDIAVPTGTKLYSAVKGTITVARYSETAGNMVTVKNSTGWTVTFMHMDSIAVSAGQDVEKGDFIGYSGNTGNSTGPHLHLQVNDASGNTVNPIFIIPQTCAGNNDD